MFVHCVLKKNKGLPANYIASIALFDKLDVRLPVLGVLALVLVEELHQLGTIDLVVFVNLFLRRVFTLGKVNGLAN